MEFTAAELRVLANEHWRDAYRALISAVGGEWRNFGSVDAFACAGLPMAFANGCLVLERASAADLDSATTWVSGFGLPHRVRLDTTLATAQVTAELAVHGLARQQWTMPGMVLAPIPDAPPAPEPVTTRRVGPADRDAYLRVAVESGLPESVARSAFLDPSLDNSNIALFVAFLEGRPVGSAMAYRSDRAGGIYAVGTVESARRRGVGSAVTWAAVEYIRQLGHNVAVLQSSPMGLSVYERMGFRTVVEYAVFIPPDQEPL